MAKAPTIGRDLLRIGEASKMLGVSEETLRNWDRAGKLTPLRHPINGYRLYRMADLRRLADQAGSAQESPDLFSASGLRGDGPVSDAKDQEDPGDFIDTPLHLLQPCHWSLSVALDPKHRPQLWTSPSSTVRRSWRKYPQEAHVLDESSSRYRRLSVDEIAVLQGFDPRIARVPGLTDRERIGALGDAVPPPVARALVSSVTQIFPLKKKTAAEICAGVGGLAEGARSANLDHLLLADMSPVAGKLLSEGGSWDKARVAVTDVRSIDFTSLRDQVGLLSGGPPCQPWSQSGLRRGANDERDLFGHLPQIVSSIRPEAFLFENVPGLQSEVNRPYLEDIVSRLRVPGNGLRYSVLVAQFNAADFGVAQVRRRVFVLGLRDATAAAVSRCFDLAATKRTHRSPSVSGSEPLWRSVGQDLSELPDPGGWRRWVGA